MGSRGELDQESWLSAVGQAVREYRKKTGLSQERLALEHGIDRTYVSGVERGVRNPSVWNLARIGMALDTAPSEILKRAEEIVEM